MNSQKTRLRAVLRRAMPPLAARTPGIFFGVLADICVIALLALSMWLIVRAGEQPPILYLNFAVVGVRAVAIGRAAFRYLERLASHNAAFTQLASLRSETFNALIPRVPGGLGQKRRGEVLASFVDDVDQLQDEPLRVRQPLFISITVTLLSLALVSVVSPLAAGVMVLFLGMAGWLAVFITDKIAGSTEARVSGSRAALADAILERVENAEVLAAYGAYDQQRQRIIAAQAELAHSQRRAAFAVGLTGGLLGLGQGVATLTVLLLAAPQLGEGLSAPMFALLVIVPAAIAEVFAQTPAALAARRRVRASAARVASLTEPQLPPELPQQPADSQTPLAGAAAAARPPLAVPRENSAGSAKAPLLQIKNLAVQHPGAKTPAFSGLDFTLHAGETLVITGDSGSGKSTLALALVRLLEYRGSYLVAGQEAREIGGPRLRQTVGLCEQQPHIFDTDLRQNLKFASPDASDEQLWQAVRRVGLGNWAKAREGLDTQLGQHGALVSGGQAQRIALARALLADFPVIILDEPTAGVDMQLADQLLHDLLEAVPQDRAVILITHTAIPRGITYTHLHMPHSGNS
ncbi:MAG: thiol reductant ABC exporter subunit CydC [Microbacteriaceae bacterium]|nr:thiol reductant ABC exporter subunit CydC [Microbacteriaceae bacterium]